ncbi:DPP IV N-terminal domain-containing protein [Bacillus pseudomycoides]|uniref:DPP IV N-terminal domain-containing protein n=1 Tax=Bacillus bingmayongensis TaxID=1150157 RepID=A0ABU5K4G3_9BACI|nr:DPP IV N-terminal domain-containing protein [Bacillus pseudomycoides]
MTLSVTDEQYEKAERLLSWNAIKDVFNGKVFPNWLDKGSRFWYQKDIRKENKRGKQFVLMNPQSNTKESAFDHAKLADSLSSVISREVDADNLPFNSFTFFNDEKAIQFEVDESTWICDLTNYQCKQIRTKKLPVHELPSPDGRWAAFIKGYNLFVRSLETGQIIQLTHDGKRYYDYGTQPESETSVLLKRLSNQKVPPAALWSPDSKQILTHRLDQRNVRKMTLIQSVPSEDAKPPVIHSYRYPLVGDKHLPLAQFVICDIEQQSLIQLDTEPVITGLLSPLSPSCQTAFWTNDSDFVYFIKMARDYRSVQFVVANVKTGEVQTLLKEKSKTFLFTDLYNIKSGNGGINVHLLCHDNSFIWHSERDGWSHLYLYDSRTGRLKNRITSGPWTVRRLIGVDEKEGWVYFTASGREPERDPYFQHLYRVRLDGSDLVLLTPENAEHNVSVSPDYCFFVDTFSRVDMPPKSVLRSTDGKLICTLEQADIELLLSNGYQIPKRFTVKAADGITDLYGILIPPAKINKGCKYPILDYIYGGPQITHTPKEFTWGGEYALGLPVDQVGGAQSFAQLGFAVILMDGRGTPYRSKEFHDFSDGRLEWSAGLEDHVVAIKQLAEQYPFLDSKKVGIYGESGGGYAAARAILTYPNVYKVAVSGCGNHDQRLYLAAWGERFQGLFNSELYREQDNTKLAKNLNGKLLLVTGDLDDNVHPALSMRMVNALIKENKDFDLLILPNRMHGISEDVYFIRRRWDYFIRNLMEVEPPKEYAIKDPMFPG